MSCLDNSATNARLPTRLEDARDHVWAVGRIRPYIGRQVGFTVEPLPRGRYFYAIRLRASTNPARVSAFTSRTFAVGGG